jgi:hypothetical protein
LNCVVRDSQVHVQQGGVLELVLYGVWFELAEVEFKVVFPFVALFSWRPQFGLEFKFFGFFKE